MADLTISTELEDGPVTCCLDPSGGKNCGDGDDFGICMEFPSTTVPFPSPPPVILPTQLPDTRTSNATPSPRVPNTGPPLPCITLSTVTTTITPTSAGATGPSASGAQGQKGNSSGRKPAPIVIGVLFGIIALVGLILLMRYYLRRKRGRDTKDDDSVLLSPTFVRSEGIERPKRAYSGSVTQKAGSYATLEKKPVMYGDLPRYIDDSQYESGVGKTWGTKSLVGTSYRGSEGHYPPSLQQYLNGKRSEKAGL